MLGRLVFGGSKGNAGSLQGGGRSATFGCAMRLHSIPSSIAAVFTAAIVVLATTACGSLRASAHPEPGWYTAEVGFVT